MISLLHARLEAARWENIYEIESDVEEQINLTKLK